MTFRLSILGLLFIGSLSASLLAQDNNLSSSKQDIYRNFLGSWNGSSERMVDGRVVTETIELTITEEPKKHQLRMDYIYKGQTVERKTRFMELLPEKQMAKMHFNADPPETYKAVGLASFQTSGMGDFACFDRTESGQNTTQVERVTFHLDRDNLKYQWASSSDGSTYKTFSVFSFKRRA